MEWLYEFLSIVGKGFGYLILYIGFLSGLLFHVFSLPGNWLIILLIIVYTFLTGFAEMGWWTIGVSVLLGIVGEVIEYFSGMWGARRFGASVPAQWGALAGGIVGAIAGSAFLLFGALLGTFLGAFLGAFLVEYIREMKSESESFQSGLGAVLGRVAGMAAKMFIGIILIGIFTYRIIRF